jgi:holin-like protein
MGVQQRHAMRTQDLAAWHVNIRNSFRRSFRRVRRPILRRLQCRLCSSRQPLEVSPLTTKRAATTSHPRVKLRECLAIAAQVALLWLLSRIGHEVVTRLQLPLPGNVAGLLLTFLALTCGVLPLRFVERGAGLLVRNLPLFFVPLAVGFVTQGHLLAAHGFAILATLIGSSAVGFAVTGRVAQFVTRWQVYAAAALREPHAQTRLDRR